MRLPRWWKKAALGAVVVVGAALAIGRRMKAPPSFYWQGSDPWGGHYLGFSQKLIEDAGCLETAVAMAENILAGQGFNPDDVNDIAKAAGAFSGPLLVLPAAADVLGLRAPDDERIHPQRGATVEDMRARIDHALSRGGLAIVNVDHARSGPGAHFVLVYGSDAAGYHAADPALARSILIDRAELQADSEWNGHPFAVGVAPIYRA